MIKKLLNSDTRLERGKGINKKKFKFKIKQKI